MDISARLEGILKERGWTKNKLAKRSGVTASTIAGIFNRNAIPTIATLEAICNGANISLSQFFAEEETLETVYETKKLCKLWKELTQEQRELIFQLIKAILEANNRKCY